MTRLRVAMFLSNAFRPDPRVAKEASSLVRAGYHVRIYCWDRQKELPGWEVVEGYEIERIHNVVSTYGSGPGQMSYTPRFWRAAIERVQEYNPDVIHCHDLDTLPIGWWLKYTRGTRLIFDAHEDYPTLMTLYLPKPLVNILRIFQRVLIKNVDSTITASSVYAEKLRKQGINPHVIGNYPDLEPFAKIDPADLHKTRELLGIRQDAYIVAYIGGFTRNRIILPLIDAALQEPDICVLIWGDGHQREAIAAAAEKAPNVQYYGWLPSHLVPLYTRMVDVIYYCLFPDYPGAVFNAPNTLSNAMAAGRPVIANDVGDLGSIIRQTGCGILIADANTPSIQGAIRSLADPELRNRLGEAGRVAALEQYNWRAAENVLVGIYRNIL